MSEVLPTIIWIVAEAFHEDVCDLTPSTRFVEDLNESLEQVEVILRCEEEFGLVIPDTDAISLLTIGELAAYIESRLRQEDVWPPPPIGP